jgi:hypothetical protein
MDDDSNKRAYLSGYADGEGCFCVSFNRSRRHRFGWEIRPSFSVSQNGDRAEVLELFQRVLGCGTLRPDRSDRTLKFETRSVSDLAAKVIPQFERYPLLSSKRNDFEVRSDRAADARRRTSSARRIRTDRPPCGIAQREQQEAVRQSRDRTGDERIVCAARKSEKREVPTRTKGVTT